MNLTEKSVLITGGNGALGRAVAQRAKALGARTVLLDRQFAPELVASHVCLPCDLCDLPALKAALDDAGDIDAVFAIAGGFDMGAAVAAADDTQWACMFDMNVLPLRNLLKILVPAMQRRGSGSIVTLGALSAREGKAGMSAYTAAKAVVMNLTESLAGELAGSGVRVNAVLPSIIDTPANRTAMPDADARQWVSPLAIADVLCFLASEASRALHGALIPVTAGQGK